MGDLNIKSTGTLSDDEQRQQQQEEIDRIKAKQAEDKLAVDKARAAAKAASSTSSSASSSASSSTTASTAKKAETEGSTVTAKASGSTSKETSLKDEAVDAGVAAVAAAVGAALGDKSGSKSKSGSGAKSGSGSKSGKFGVIAIVAILVILAIVFLPKLLNTSQTTTTGATATSSGDISMGAKVVDTKIDFNDAILTQSKQEKKLIVFKQNVDVSTEISSALADMDIFRKTKQIKSFGTGAFTVDLSKVTESSITVDDDAKTVTIAIPHTHLDSITVDHDKTEFTQTDDALLAFGDLKLTAEQQNAIDQSIEAAMREQLATKDVFALADDAASAQVYEVYQPVIAKLSDQYLLQIVFDDATTNVDDSDSVYSDVASSSSSSSASSASAA